MKMYQIDTLSQQDRERMRKLNTKNGYGFSFAQLRKLCTEHEKAYLSGDLHKMQMIEYRLTDANFHYECAMLSNGKYEGLRRKLREGEFNLKERE